jgi:hypothetical protein
MPDVGVAAPACGASGANEMAENGGRKLTLTLRNRGERSLGRQ